MLDSTRNQFKFEKKEKVLVTGAGGFIGSHLVESLLEKGHEVVCLVKPGEDIRWIRDLKATFLEGDLTHRKTLDEPMDGVSYVYHLAARMGGGDKPSYLYRVNYEGSKNLIRACRESGAKLKRFLFVSSVAAVGPTGDSGIFDEKIPPRPRSHYGKCKLLVENHLRETRGIIPSTIVRLPLVYGPRSLRGLYAIFKIVNSGFQLRVRNSETNLGYVKDIVKGMILAAESPVSVGQIYFLGEDKAYGSRELFRQIAAALGKKTINIPVPYHFLYALTFMVEEFADLVGAHVPLRRDSLASYLNSHWRFRMTKAELELHYRTEYPLAKGLKTTADWYKTAGFL